MKKFTRITLAIGLAFGLTIGAVPALATTPPADIQWETIHPAVELATTGDYSALTTGEFSTAASSIFTLITEDGKQRVEWKAGDLYATGITDDHDTLIAFINSVIYAVNNLTAPPTENDTEETGETEETEETGETEDTEETGETEETEETDNENDGEQVGTSSTPVYINPPSTPVFTPDGTAAWGDPNVVCHSPVVHETLDYTEIICQDLSASVWGATQTIPETNYNGYIDNHRFLDTVLSLGGSKQAIVEETHPWEVTWINQPNPSQTPLIGQVLLSTNDPVVSNTEIFILAVDTYRTDPGITQLTTEGQLAGTVSYTQLDPTTFLVNYRVSPTWVKTVNGFVTAYGYDFGLFLNADVQPLWASQAKPTTTGWTFNYQSAELPDIENFLTEVDNCSGVCQSVGGYAISGLATQNVPSEWVDFNTYNNEAEPLGPRVNTGITATSTSTLPLLYSGIVLVLVVTAFTVSYFNRRKVDA